jgi:hypothetical protein
MTPVTIFNSLKAWLDDPQRSGPLNRLANLFCAAVLAVAIPTAIYGVWPYLRDSSDKLDAVAGDLAQLKLVLSKDNKTRDDALLQQGNTLIELATRMHDIDKRVVRVETRQEFGRGVP